LIDLRLLRYFVAVAEVEHVGRAAEALRISQSPLSRQLRLLEDALELRLFDRERQRLRLTKAGHWLLRESQTLLEHADRLRRDASRLAKGEAGGVRIGFVKTAMWAGVLPVALRAFKRNRPNVSVEVRNAVSSLQAAAVLRGDLDVGLVHELPSQAGIVHACLLKEPLLLALPSEHPLARNVSISPASLDGADWIVLSLKGRIPERFVAACGSVGFVPKLRFRATDQSTVLGLVEAGVGLALLPRSAERAAPAGVVLRRLPWLRWTRLLYAIRRDAAASPFAVEIVTLLKECASIEGKRPERISRGDGVRRKR
jgi:DNA-binding transcriptional LysR family regulator